MSFDVYIQDMEAHVDLPQWQAARAKAYEAHIAGISQDKVALTLKSGDEVELFDQGQHAGCMVALHSLTPDVCAFLFDLVDHSGLFMLPTIAEPRAVRARNNPRPPFPDRSLQELEIADGAELYAFLSGGYDAWSAYRDQQVRAQKQEN